MRIKKPSPSLTDRGLPTPHRLTGCLIGVGEHVNSGYPVRVLSRA